MGLANMHLRYDEDFVEAGVLLCASGQCPGISSLQIGRYHREREKLYGILDPDERNSAFFRLHLEWFREWGLEAALTEPLREFRLLGSVLTNLVFRKCRGKDDEEAELYINEAGQRTGVIALRAERLAQASALGAILRHEFTHLQDMVDPAFGYRPELPWTGAALGSQRLARERYRLLWDVCIDGRLTRAGSQTVATRDQRWLAFRDAFPFWEESKQAAIFDSLWRNLDINHESLQKLVSDPRGLEAGSGPRAGAPCPLCGFPTFAWGAEENLTSGAVAAIRGEFPSWAPEHGACSRCLAIYRVKRSTLTALV
jgi:hypothetical protein